MKTELPAPVANKPAVVAVQEGPALPTSVDPETTSGTQIIKEVSVGDLEQELQALGAHVSALAGSLATVFNLREVAIVQGPTFPATELARLAQLTTEISRQLVNLPVTFTLTGQRLLRLDSLVALDQIAALASELDTLREQYAAARLEAKQTVVERIRAEAWDEVDARESAWRRCEERVAVENPALNAGEVRRAVEAAFEGASDGKVADLDITSYAGRLAAENPATELAQILDDHADGFRAAFSESQDLSLDRQSTRLSGATGTTLVDAAVPEGSYSKIGHAEDSKSGLQRMPTSATLAPGGVRPDEELGLLGATTSPELPSTQSLSRIGRLRKYWRDYLVRTFLLLCILALIAGIATSQVLTARSQAADSAANPLSWTAYPTDPA
ncbi:hypothetical protein JCM3774_004128 [Rhodotorula dairenensis]